MALNSAYNFAIVTTALDETFFSAVNGWQNGDIVGGSGGVEGIEKAEIGHPRKLHEELLRGMEKDGVR